MNLSDKSQWANTSFAFARQLYNMLELSSDGGGAGRCGCGMRAAARTTSRTFRIATMRSS